MLVKAEKVLEKLWMVSIRMGVLFLAYNVDLQFIRKFQPKLLLGSRELSIKVKDGDFDKIKK